MWEGSMSFQRVVPTRKTPIGRTLAKDWHRRPLRTRLLAAVGIAEGPGPLYPSGRGEKGVASRPDSGGQILRATRSKSHFEGRAPAN